MKIEMKGELSVAALKADHFTQFQLKAKHAGPIGFRDRLIGGGLRFLMPALPVVDVDLSSELVRIRSTMPIIFGDPQGQTIDFTGPTAEPRPQMFSGKDELFIHLEGETAFKFQVAGLIIGIQLPERYEPTG